MTTPNFSTEITTLLTTLDNLLANLHIPISLQSPQDLTPSLLIAILESTLKSRLPILPHIRQSRSLPEKIHATKIFLGVLEHDILQTDVGLSDVNPRQLALGGWDEVVFVGELLCWLGKKRGILPPETVETLRDIEDSSVLPTMRRRQPLSPSTHSTVTDSADSELSVQSAQSNSDTTVTSESRSSGGSSMPSTAAHPTTTTITRRPRCIHELDESIVIFSPDSDVRDISHPEIDAFSSMAADSKQSYCACSTHQPTIPPPSQHTHTPVRYTRRIDTVDDSIEVESFEARKVGTRDRNQPASSGSGSQSQFPYRNPATHTSPKTPLPLPTTNRILTKHTSPSEHTLALRNERARLLAELAKFRAPPS